MTVTVGVYSLVCVRAWVSIHGVSQDGLGIYMYVCMCVCVCVCVCIYASGRGA